MTKNYTLYINHFVYYFKLVYINYRYTGNVNFYLTHYYVSIAFRSV